VGRTGGTEAAFDSFDSFDSLDSLDSLDLLDRFDRLGLRTSVRQYRLDGLEANTRSIGS
jgi:hypothetical protein